MADLKYLNKYYLKTSFEMVGPIYIYKTYYYPYTKHNGLNCLNFVRPSCKLNREHRRVCKKFKNVQTYFKHVKIN